MPTPKARRRRYRPAAEYSAAVRRHMETVERHVARLDALLNEAMDLTYAGLEPLSFLEWVHLRPALGNLGCRLGSLATLATEMRDFVSARRQREQATPPPADTLR